MYIAMARIKTEEAPNLNTKFRNFSSFLASLKTKSNEYQSLQCHFHSKTKWLFSIFLCIQFNLGKKNLNNNH